MRSDFLSKLISKSTPDTAAASRERPSRTAPDGWGSLMVAAQNGHGGAYQRLLGEMSEWLTRYFRRRLPPGDVDDAVQETLPYDPQYPLGPWLAAIAKNKWVDQLRSLARRPVDELPDDMAVGDHEASVVSSSALASLLDEIRPAQAQAILLVEVQGEPRALPERQHLTGNRS